MTASVRRGLEGGAAREGLLGLVRLE
jgi:hypothetical protein